MTPFTPTEQRVLEVLADGRPHSRDEIRVAVDDLAEDATIRNHISRIRKKLEAAGQTITCVYVNRRFMYMHVRLLVPHSRG